MRNYRDFVKEVVKNPEEAMEYLKVALDVYEKDGNLEAFLIALKTVVEVQGGGMSDFARKTSLNRQSLYKTLSKKRNPRLQTLHTILHELGFKLSIESIAS